MNCFLERNVVFTEQNEMQQLIKKKKFMTTLAYQSIFLLIVFEVMNISFSRFSRIIPKFENGHKQSDVHCLHPANLIVNQPGKVVEHVEFLRSIGDTEVDPMER